MLNQVHYIIGVLEREGILGLVGARCQIEGEDSRSRAPSDDCGVRIERRVRVHSNVVIKRAHVDALRTDAKDHPRMLFREELLRVMGIIMCVRHSRSA